MNKIPVTTTTILFGIIIFAVAYSPSIAYG